MSIRLRLTLLYSAILALTLVVFGAALYAIQARSTLEALQRDLTHSGDRLVQGIQFLARDQSEPLPERRPPPPFDALSGEPAFQNLREREIVRVLDTSGALVASPLGGGTQALPLSQAGLKAVQDGQVWWEIGLQNGERVLIYNRPVEVEDQVILIVQSARPLTEHDRSLAALSRTLFGAGLLTILAAFGIGWLLAGVSLRPIHHITQTARAIGGAGEVALGQRVDYRGPNDEIGQLATTFNSMLARLQEAYQRLSQALKMQREFVADVSHELRTPLTTVRGNLALLRRQPPLPPAEQADILNDLVDESDRLIRLVNDLLVLARADAGRSPLIEPTAIRPLIEEACRQAQPLDQQRKLTVDSTDLVALAERDALKQVLLILLDNALKHSRGDIHLSAAAADGQVQLRVCDSGPGIPPEELSHLFDRFYRGHTDPAVPGFGLGLAIAKALIENQGGSITIESQPGRGTEARVELPQAPGL